MTIYYTNPKTKGDLLNRILSQDFNGDFRDLAVDGNLDVTRIKDHAVQLKFPEGPTFILAVRKPKPLGARIAAKERWKRQHEHQTGTAEAPTGRYAVPPKTPVSPVGRYSKKPAPTKGKHSRAAH